MFDDLYPPPPAIIGLNDISTGKAGQRLKDLATVASGFNVILWMGLVFFPFIQVQIMVLVITGGLWSGQLASLI